MNYRRNNTNKKKIIIGVLLLGLFIFIYFHKPILYKISNTFSFISPPIMKADKGVRNIASPVFAFFSSKQKLSEENRILKSELEVLELDSISNRLLTEENRFLKEMMGRFDKKEVILAAVLSKPNHSPYDTLIIDAGKNDGVQDNDLVMFGDKFAIGTVSEVYNNSSKVILFSNPSNVMQVWIGALSIPAEAKGKGGGNFKIILPRDLVVRSGDIVSVPGINIDILGVVGYVKKDPADSFQTILFRTPINISELKWVQIIKPL